MKSKIPRLIKLNGNNKLKEGGIAYFSLPPGPPICKMACPGCYAMKAYRLYPNVRRNYLDSYKASLKNNFVDVISRQIELIKDKILAIRVHDSGDFYSQEYVNKWVEIARRFPTVKFFSYTKRMEDFDFSEMLKLPNFALIDSLKFGILNYGPKEQMLEMAKKTGAYVCPATLTHNQITCGNGCDICIDKNKGEKKGVLFIKH
jgi:hypothetical protein